MFVMRNEDGEVVGAFENEQSGVATEYLDSGSPELIDFYSRLNHKKDDPDA